MVDLMISMKQIKKNRLKKKVQILHVIITPQAININSPKIAEQISTQLFNDFLFSDQKINNLISKNDRLRTQIRKIEKILLQNSSLQQKQKPQYGLKLPQIRGQVAQKQLQNAYKLIKHYEYQIQRMRTLQKQGSFAIRYQFLRQFIFRLTKAQRNLRQKQQLKDKLKIQYQKLKKVSKGITKSLIDDRTKIIFQNKSKKINDELKIYEKKLSQEDRKRQFFIQTQKKKKQYILQLEKKLWESGVLREEINQIRYKIFEVQVRKKSQEKDQEEEKQVIEDRTPQAYKSLLSQIKLLRKVTIANQKQIEKFQSQKGEFSQKNKLTQIKLEQTQKEIKALQNELNFLKKHIDPQKFKPKLKPLSQGTLSSSFNYATIRSGDSVSQHFASRNISILQHHFEIVQLGSINKRSQKYNDRKILGKKSAKIIGIQLYENRMQLLGAQFTYLVGTQKIQGTLMMIKNENQRHLQKKILQLEENDYFATIQCFVNKKNIIIGIIFTSHTGRMIKAGNLEGSIRYLQMNPKEYPTCVYACISKEGIQLLGVQKVQPQFFQK